MVKRPSDTTPGEVSLKNRLQFSFHENQWSLWEADHDIVGAFIPRVMTSSSLLEDRPAKKTKVKNFYS